MYEILTADGFKRIDTRPGTSFIEKFGRNPAVGAGTSEDVWDKGGIYDFPAVAAKFDITSTNAEDGAGTLTGALTLEIQGLDENWDRATETVTLTGLVAKATANKFIRIYRMTVLTAGASGSNIGIISADSQAEVITAAQILATNGQTGMAIWSVPRNRIGFIKHWYVSLLRATGATATAVDIDMFKRSFGGAWTSTQPIGFQNNGAGMHKYEFLAPIQLSQKSDIVVNVTPTAAADVTAGFTSIIIHA